MLSLVGKWRLIREGSDFLPGVDHLVGAPLSLQLCASSADSAEYLKIEKRKLLESEEIHISHISKNQTNSIVYQIGTMNFESTSINQGIIFAIVQNCNDFFEFCIVRLGPHYGQSSREVYALNPATGELKLTVEVIGGDGTHMTIINYLKRVAEVGHSNVDTVLFLKSSRTLGWGLYQYWPSSLLSQCSALIVKAVKIRTSSTGEGRTSSKEHSRLIEPLWTREAFHNDFHVDYSLIPRYAGGVVKDAEDIVVFIIQVFFEGHAWYVVHRYSDFDVLKSFLLQQNPYNNEFKQAAQNFPKKVFGIGFRQKLLEQRALGLNEFLSFFLKNAKFGRQNSVDALLSFLLIPENVANTHNPEHPVAELPVSPPIKRRGNPSQQQFSSALAAASAIDSKQQRGPNYVQASSHAGAIQRTVGFAEPKSSPSGASASAEVKQTPAPPPPPTSSAPAAAASEQREKSKQKREPNPRKLKALLKSGLQITKHGRSGAPKVRTLRCNESGSVLYWDDKLSEKSKQIKLSEVDQVRLGTDIDPETPEFLLHQPLNEANNDAVEELASVAEDEKSVASSNAQDSQAGGAKRPRSKMRRKVSIFRRNKILLGTANLRRHCQPEDHQLCVSLILPDRTLDIQCFKIEEFEQLVPALREACGFYT